MRNECLDAITTELTAVGVPFDVEYSGRHIHVRYGNDREHLHVVAKTPSDWRAEKNERASIRRDLRALGYVTENEEPQAATSPNVYINAGGMRCSTVDVARNFDKAHKDVLRAVDGVRENCGPEFDQRNFAPIEYQDAKGRTYRAVEMTRDGFSLVVMGFTGKSAMGWKVAYIDAFNRMASALEQYSGRDAVEAMRGDLDAALSLMAGVESYRPESRRVVSLPKRMIARQDQRREMRREARA